MVISNRVLKRKIDEKSRFDYNFQDSQDEGEVTMENARIKLTVNGN